MCALCYSAWLTASYPATSQQLWCCMCTFLCCVQYSEQHRIRALWHGEKRGVAEWDESRERGHQDSEELLGAGESEAATGGGHHGPVCSRLCGQTAGSCHSGRTSRCLVAIHMHVQWNLSIVVTPWDKDKLAVVERWLDYTVQLHRLAPFGAKHYRGWPDYTGLR